MPNPAGDIPQHLARELAVHPLLPGGHAVHAGVVAAAAVDLGDGVVQESLQDVPEAGVGLDAVY